MWGRGCRPTRWRNSANRSAFLNCGFTGRRRGVGAPPPPAAWGEIVEAAETARARSQGAYGPGAEWLERFCTGKSKAWYFYWISVGHNHLHLGQARWVRKLLLGKGQV